MKSQSKEQEGSHTTLHYAALHLCIKHRQFSIQDVSMHYSALQWRTGRESCTLFTGCQDLKLPPLLHQTTDTSMHFLPQCICVFYYLSLVLRVSGDRKLGIGLLPAPPLLPNFGGNGNFHILVEIENIKSGSGGEYLLYMHQRVMQFRKLSKCWLCTGMIPLY